MDYPGYRVSLRASFGQMKDKVQVDIGVGDVVKPEIRDLKLFQYKGKSFFEGEISLRVYPLESIFAEKLETILSKGAANSRMKDYHDLFLLIKEESLLDSDRLQEAIQRTFQNRRTPLGAIQFGEDDLKGLQKLWYLHCLGLGRTAEDLRLSQNLGDIISALNQFL